MTISTTKRRHRAVMTWACPTCLHNGQEVGAQITIVLPDPVIELVEIRCKSCGKTYVWDARQPSATFQRA